MNTIKECFDIILRGSEEDSRLAARKVRKLLYNSRDGRDKFDVLKNIINGASDEYAKISEDFRRENFVIAISVLYYLHDRENQPDFLFPWLFGLLQHTNGNIRHAAVRMLEHELGSLTYHIRFPGEKSSSRHELLPEQADSILFGMYTNLMNLIDYFWKPIYEKHKYISSLPNGPYKSVQMLLSRLEDDCGEKYMA